MENGNIVKKIFSTIGIMICLFAIGIVSYYLYSMFTTQAKEGSKTNYTTSSSMDYKVYIKENNYISDDYLGMDENYITRLVDKITTDIKFNYSSEEADTVNYYYSITGTLVSNYEDPDVAGQEQDVWTKEDKIKSGNGNSTTGSISIEEPVTIDFSAIDSKVKSFQEDMAISFTAYYKVELNVRLTFNIDGETVNKDHTSYLNIPVNTNVFQIDKSIENNVEKTIAAAQAKAEEINKMYLIFAVSILALAFIILVLLLKYGYKETKTEYEDEMEQIFDVYGDRIVSVESINTKEDSEIIDLLGFEEMIELVNELNLPILCWTKEKNVESWFCAIKGNIIYRYLVQSK